MYPRLAGPPMLPPTKLGTWPLYKLGIFGLKGVVVKVPDRVLAVAAAATVLGLLRLVLTPFLFLLNPTNPALIGFIVVTPATIKFFLLKLPIAVTRGVAPPILFGVIPFGPNIGNLSIGMFIWKLPWCVTILARVSIVSFNASIIPGKLFMLSILILELFKLITLWSNVVTTHVVDGVPFTLVFA